MKHLSGGTLKTSNVNANSYHRAMTHNLLLILINFVQIQVLLAHYILLMLNEAADNQSH